MVKSSNIVVSPCISVCKTDSVTGYCYGCARTNEEKKIWKNKKTTNVWKKENLRIVVKRMSSWQLENFNVSYRHKIKRGISLFKENLVKKN